MGGRAAGLFACLAALFAASAIGASAAEPVAGAPCPTVVRAADFAGQAGLRRMTAKFNSFGPRILGSSAHNKASTGWRRGSAQRG